MTCVDEIRQILPGNLLAVAYDLDNTGNVAWRYKDVKEVLAYLKTHGKVILGGEVFTLSKERIDLTWDLWEYQIDPALSPDANIERSYDESVSYLDSYRKKFGDDFCYSVAFR